MHVDEDFAQLPVLEFSGVKVDLVAADRCFLDVALATVRQFLALGSALDNPFDDFLDDFGGRRLRRGGFGLD